MRFRRLITIPGFCFAWLVWILAAPLWLTVAVAVDVAFRKRSVCLRSAVLIAVYLSCEVVGIFASGGIWAWAKITRMPSGRWESIHYRLETWWGSTLFRALAMLFGLRIEVEDEADLGRGPYLLLPRHASTGDTLIAAALVSQSHGVHLRYVLKRENLWDPCLDIVGNRLPNYFIDRFSKDSAAEVERLSNLAGDLGPRDGILLYPEGTRFSEQKREGVLLSLERRGDSKMLEYARSLKEVLPPRTGGTIGLLDGAPEADVVICSHVGFEGAASLTQIWKGVLVDRTIRVQFRRIPRAEIPEGREERVAWLQAEWRSVDSWVQKHRHREVPVSEPVAVSLS